MAREHDTPILAAGGVTRGEHLVAALALGAAGVWCTIWQATTESHIERFLKDKLVKAATEDLTKSRSLTGKPAARLRSKFIRRVGGAGRAADPRDAAPADAVAKNVQAIGDHHVEDFMNVAVGQGVGLIDEIRPTRQVIEDMVDEARAVLEGTPLRA